VPAPVRRAVLGELLEPRVSAPVRRAAAYAAQAVPAPEVPGAISWLAKRASLAAEGVELPVEPLGHLAARVRVGGFATALYEDMTPGELEEMEDELFRFARTVEAVPELRTLLTDRDRPVEVRQGVVDDLLTGRAEAATVRLVDYVVAAGRARDVVGTLDWLVEQTAQARGWRVARVRSAAELAPDQHDELATTMARLVGAPVELEVVLDPRLIGGAVVEVGDLLVDASARGRLDNLREHLGAGRWAEPRVSLTDPDTEH